MIMRLFSFLFIFVPFFFFFRGRASDRSAAGSRSPFIFLSRFFFISAPSNQGSLGTGNSRKNKGLLRPFRRACSSRTLFLREDSTFCTRPGIFGMGCILLPALFRTADIEGFSLSLCFLVFNPARIPRRHHLCLLRYGTCNSTDSSSNGLPGPPIAAAGAFFPRIPDFFILPAHAFSPSSSFNLSHTICANRSAVSLLNLL